jgi:hypothetical protein
MKRILSSIVLAILSLVVLARAEQHTDENVKMGLRRRVVSKPISLDSSIIEHTEGLSEFLFTELDEEDEKLWTDIMKSPLSMSMSISHDKPTL